MKEKFINARLNNKTPSPTGVNSLLPGSFLYWSDQIYEVKPHEKKNGLYIIIENIITGERGELGIAELLKPAGKDFAPIFAPTLTQLRSEVANIRASDRPLVSEAGLTPKLLQKADFIINTYLEIAQMLEITRNRGKGQATDESDVLKDACAIRNIGLTSYYKYRNLYTRYNANREALAISLKKRAADPADKAQYHFMDTLIMRYFARSTPLRPSKLYEVAISLLERTGNLWIDPDKCGIAEPQNLINELFDHKLPVAAILANPEKSKLLKSVKLPSRGWFYNYLNYFKAHPETGKDVIIARYGKDAWDNNYMSYDSFVTLAAHPLQYVFADHWLTDIFIVDEETRGKVTRLWLTVLIDAYSRCILGLALNYEAPCIESIQGALLHSIWPKTSHTKWGITKEWIAYGIPSFLSLDNAWAHHSISLENLSRSISQGGKWNSITLMFRPPYKGRYGALIERYFRNLSEEFKQTLPGGILSSQPKDVQNAAKQACLLYQDVDELVHKMVVEYQHTPHSELNGLTPHQKWLEAMQANPVLVPPLTKKIERLFWRAYPDTRQNPQEGIRLFGMHYWSDFIGELERIDKRGQKLEYGIAYQPENISTIALFRDGGWVGDVYAKELKQPDNSYRSISLWEKEIAKDLAVANRKSSRDWLEHINEIDDLTKTRQTEKKKKRRSAEKLSVPATQRHITQKAVQTADDAIKAARNTSTNQEADYNKLLLGFSVE